MINNAGIMQVGPFETLDEKISKLTMDVNCMSNLYIVKEFLPEMIKRDEGHIVTVSSLCGVAAVPNLTDYAASKFASVGFSEALMAEMVSNNRNITVTLACPYFFDSGMFKDVKHRFILPLLKMEKVADRIIYGIT